MQQEVATRVRAALLDSSRSDSCLTPGSDAYVFHRLACSSKLPLTSLSAQADTLETDRRHLKRTACRGASALVQLAGYMWGCLLSRVSDGVLSNKWRALLLVKRRRYDETPSRIAVGLPAGDSCMKREKEQGSTHFAKIMQTEMDLCILLQSVADPDRLQCWVGSLPTFLQAMEKTNAIVTYKTQIATESAVPELDRASELCRHAVQLVTTDAYSANLAAEHMMQNAHPSFTKCHYKCDVHKLYRCQTAQFRLVDGHVTGLIAGAVAMSAAGSVSKLREALFTVIQERLVVRYGSPPEDYRDYREHVFDLFLQPTIGGSAGGVVRKAFNRRTLLQRLVLGYFLSGDLHNRECVEFWTTFGDLDKGTVLQGFRHWVLPMLVPTKPRVFPRSRWVGAEESVDFFGLIDCCHGLLRPMLMVWARKSITPERPVEFGWSFLQDEVDADFAPTAAQPIAFDAAEAEADAEQPQQPKQQPESGNVDWHEYSKRMKVKVVSWVENTAVGPAMVVFRSAMSPSISFMADLLNICSDEWELRQRAREAGGQQRSYEVLECAVGGCFDRFNVHVERLMQTPLRAMPRIGQVRKYQVLYFRMMSAILCRAHYKLKLSWESYPVKLFKMLRGSGEQLLQDRQCLWDELATMVFRSYPTISEINSPECQSVLQALAQMFSTNIAQIEARHASTRRILHVSGVQSKTPCLDWVSATWVARRNKLSRSFVERSRHGTAPSGQNVHRHPSGPAPAKSNTKPGGPWRAFLHVHCAGRKFDKVMIQQLKNQYLNLTQQQKQRFVELGRLATVAGRLGHKPFGLSNEEAEKAALADSAAAAIRVANEADENLSLATLARVDAGVGLQDLSACAQVAKRVAAEQSKQMRQSAAKELEVLSNFRADPDCFQEAVNELPIMKDSSVATVSRKLPTVQLHVPADDAVQARCFDQIACGCFSTFNMSTNLSVFVLALVTL